MAHHASGDCDRLGRDDGRDDVLDHAIHLLLRAANVKLLRLKGLNERGERGVRVWGGGSQGE